MKRIIPADRSIVVSADVSHLDAFHELLVSICGIPEIGAIKVGALLGLSDLEFSIELVRGLIGADFPVIYDHQKGGTDIPEMGAPFARLLKGYGVDAVILFPFTGPRTQMAWTDACLSEGLTVLTGGMMTHPQFLKSEGGYIHDDAPEQIYRLACKLGVRDFVVPGTKVAWVKKIREWLERELGRGEFDLYAPGFIAQGGDITECGREAGPRFHAIVGRHIYGQRTTDDIRRAAMTVARAVHSA